MCPRDLETGELLFTFDLANKHYSYGLRAVCRYPQYREYKYPAYLRANNIYLFFTDIFVLLLKRVAYYYIVFRKVPGIKFKYAFGIFLRIYT